MATNEITQNPLNAPLPGIVGGDTAMDTAPPATQSGLKSIFLNTPTDSYTSDVNKQIQSIEAKSAGFMPTFIATAAALSGNFGPAFTLYQQKRATSLAKQMLPAMGTINTLKNQGKLDEALAAAEQLGASVGAQSPELVPYFQRLAGDISDRQYKLRLAKDMYNIWGKNVEKEHPDYPVWQSIKTAADSGMPVTWEAMKEFVQSRPHIQELGGKISMTSPATGAKTFTPVPEFVSDDELKTFGGMQVQSAYGLTQADLHNVLKGFPVQNITPEKANEIRQSFVSTKAMDSVLKYVSPLVPLEPIMATQLLETTSPLRVALRETMAQMPDTMKRHYGRLTEQKIAEIEGGLRADPFKGAQAGLTFIDFRSPGMDFGREMPLMTAREAAASGGGIVPVRQQVADTIIKPALSAKQGLLKITDLLVALSNPEGLLEALPAELNLRASRLLGRGVAPGMKQATAASVILKRAIEEAGQTMKVPESDVGALKSQIASEFINPQDSIDAVNMLIDWINDRMKREVGSSNVQEGFVPPYNPNPTQQQQEEINKFGLGKVQKGYQEHLKQQRQQKYQGVK